MTVQVQSGRCTTEVETAPVAALQRQRHHGFLVGGIHRNLATTGVDLHPIVDDGSRGVLVVHIANAATHRSTAITYVGGFDVLQCQVTGRVQRGYIGGGGDIGCCIETARTRALRFGLVFAVVQPVQRGGPRGAAGITRGQPGARGDVGSGTVAGLEVADRTAQCELVSRATGRRVRGE